MTSCARQIAAIPEIGVFETLAGAFELDTDVGIRTGSRLVEVSDPNRADDALDVPFQRVRLPFPYSVERATDSPAEAYARYSSPEPGPAPELR